MLVPQNGEHLGFYSVQGLLCHDLGLFVVLLAQVDGGEVVEGHRLEADLRGRVVGGEGLEIVLHAPLEDLLCHLRVGRSNNRILWGCLMLFKIYEEIQVHI